MDARAYITLIPAPDESSAKAVWQQAVADEAQLRTEISNLIVPPVKKPDKEPLRRADDKGDYKGTFRAVHLPRDIMVLQEVTKTLLPAICAAIGAWLASRNGRKVRIKIGDIEAEAQTREEVERLLTRAQEIQQRNQQPKIFPVPGSARARNEP